MTASEATATASAWLKTLGAALAAGDAAAAATLFGDECYWRDLVALTWNIRTVEGRDAIAAMLAATLPASRPYGFASGGRGRKRTATSSKPGSRFETAAARGKGHLRLRNGKGLHAADHHGAN